MAQFLPFILLGIVLVAVVVWVVLKNRASSTARAQQLLRLGFSPCPGEAHALAERIKWLENNSEYRYSVKDPMQASLDGNTAYYYTKSRRWSEDVVSTQEFLVPLKRPSADGVMLFVKPRALPGGTGANLIGAMATAGWDAQPDDLTKLEIPVELRGSNLIGALGPTGASLYDLIDAGTLATMQQVGDGGAPIVTCRGEWCSFTSPGPLMPFNLDRIWAVIRELA